jgi:hypothetical protein
VRNPRGTVREDQLAVRDDHPFDRKLAERVERGEQRLAVGLVDEDVQPAAGAAKARRR